MAKYLDQAGLQLVLSKLTNKYDGRYLGLHATADAAQKTVHKLTINVRDEESRVFDGSADFSIDVAQASHTHPASEVLFTHAGMSNVANVNEALDVLIKNVQIASGVLSSTTANMNTLKEALDQEVADRKQAITDEETARKNADTGLDNRIKALEELLNGSGNVNEAILAVIERLAAEEQRSLAKDTEHDNAIANHKSRLETIEGDGEGSIKKAVKDEQDRAVAKENELSQAITTEKGRAEAAEKDLADDLAEEVTARTNADTALSERISANKGRLDVLEADENTEGSIAKDIKDAEARVKVVTDALDGRMTGAEGRLDTIQGTGEGSIKKAIADLVNGAPEQLDTLKEISEALRDNADVLDAIEEAFDTKLEAETTERERVQGVHEQRMTDIETAAAQEVQDRKDAVTAEANARKDADDALDERILEIEGLIGDESMSLKDIREAIEANQKAIQAEVKTRGEEDKKIQDQIDIIDGAADVEGSFRKAIADQAATQLAKDNAQDARVEALENKVGNDGGTAADSTGLVATLRGAIESEATTRASEDARLEGRIADIEGLIGGEEGSASLKELNDRLKDVEAEQLVQNKSIADNAAAIAAIVALEEADIDAAFNAVFQ
jgi:chromosome segregation ATPase